MTRVFRVALLIASLLVAGGARADAAGGRPGRAAPQRELDAWAERLRSEDPEVVQTALVRLRRAHPLRATNAVAARLHEGLPPRLAMIAIETLVRLERPARARRVLLELTHHRRASLRARALRALGELGVRDATSPLLDGLDDSERQVRMAAADALSMLRTRKALRRLFALVDKGDEGMLPFIARLATPRHEARLLKAMAALPVSKTAPLLVTLLSRDDYPRAAKQQLIDKLRDSGRADVHTLLARIRRGLPARQGALRLRIAKAMVAVEREAATHRFASDADAQLRGPIAQAR